MCITFSLDFLHRGIDNWFDLQFEQSLDDSLELSRLALDLRMKEILKQTEQIAEEFTEINNAAVPFEIDEFRIRSGAEEFYLDEQKREPLSLQVQATD